MIIGELEADTRLARCDRIPHPSSPARSGPSGPAEPARAVHLGAQRRHPPAQLPVGGDHQPAAVRGRAAPARRWRRRPSRARRPPGRPHRPARPAPRPRPPAPPRPGAGSRGGTPPSATGASASRSRAAAPARSRHQPSGREPDHVGAVHDQQRVSSMPPSLPSRRRLSTPAVRVATARPCRRRVCPGRPCRARPRRTDMMGPGDFGSDPWDEFLARYFGRGEGGRRPPHRVDITRLMTADAREMLADAARRAAAAAAAATWTPTTCSGRRCSANRCGTWSAAPAPTRTPCSTRSAGRGDGAPRGRGAAEPVAHPGRQAGAARRPPALPGDGRQLHRPRAHPDGAAAQPGVAGRPDARRRPDPARVAAGGQRRARAR